MDKREPLHPSLRDALVKLYGYTSDKDGIRHPILEQKRISFDEAKFMVVVCSAFVNLLLTADERRADQ